MNGNNTNGTGDYVNVAPENQDNNGLIYTAITVVGVLLLGLLIYFVFTYEDEIAESIGERVEQQVEVAQEKNYFQDIELEAKSAYVFDIAQNKVLYEKNANTQMPLASLTKTMVALAASDIVPPDTKVVITAADLREEGDTGLLRDEKWSLGKLLDFALVVSSNDAIRAIANVAGRELVKDGATSSQASFVKRMNDLANGIGMNQTYFLNGSGLDLTKVVSGGYGSAHDVAMLFKYIIETRPELMTATRFDALEINSDDKKHIAENTNKIVNSIPNILASKTGYTELSGGNLAVVFDAGLMNPVAVVVLGSSYDGRFTDIQKLVRATLKY